MGRSENRRKKKLSLPTSPLCLLSQATKPKTFMLGYKMITRRYERNISNTLVREVLMEDESEFRSMFTVQIE